MTVKNIKTALLLGVFLVLLLTGQPAWAASATLWQIPGSLSLDEAGFRLEAPNISDRAVRFRWKLWIQQNSPQTTILARAVSIEMVNVDGLT